MATRRPVLCIKEQSFKKRSLVMKTKDGSSSIFVRGAALWETASVRMAEMDTSSFWKESAGRYCPALSYGSRWGCWNWQARVTVDPQKTQARLCSWPPTLCFGWAEIKLSVNITGAGGLSSGKSTAFFALRAIDIWPVLPLVWSQRSSEEGYL